LSHAPSIFPATIVVPLEVRHTMGHQNLELLDLRVAVSTGLIHHRIRGNHHIPDHRPFPNHYPFPREAEVLKGKGQHICGNILSPELGIQSLDFGGPHDPNADVPFRESRSVQEAASPSNQERPIQ
jgi:hypothetical protein